MRYPPAETAARHRRLVTVASAMIRERGIEKVSVSEVMQAAGMTHGAFPSHFGSKDELASAAFQEAMDQKEAFLSEVLADPASAKDRFVEHYLSPAHRDNCADSCPMAALAVEIGRRNNDRDRSTLARYLRGLVDRFVSGFRWGNRGSKRDQAILMTTAMLGAIIIARAVNDRQLSDEIMAATMRQLLLEEIME